MGAQASRAADAEKGETALVPAHNLLTADRLLIFVTVLFWMCISFLGAYSIVIQVHYDSLFSWLIIHDLCFGLVLISIAFLGGYWETRNLRLVELGCVEQTLQWLYLVLLGGFVSAGPWSPEISKVEDRSKESEVMTAFGRALCVVGFLLATAKVAMGCLKRVHRKALRLALNNGAETSLVVHQG